jgi:hypothetical protein
MVVISESYAPHDSIFEVDLIGSYGKILPKIDGIF